VHHLCVLSDPSEELGGPGTLAVVEGGGDVVVGFVLGQVVLPSCDDDARVFCLSFGEVADCRHLYRQLLKRKVLARGEAATKGYETWCAEELCGILEGIALAYLRFMAKHV
jgi:hypothetical protein